MARFCRTVSSSVSTPPPPSDYLFQIPPLPHTLSYHFPTITRPTISEPNKAKVLTSENLLVPATDDNKEKLTELFGAVRPDGPTNFEEVSSQSSRVPLSS